MAAQMPHITRMRRRTGSGFSLELHRCEPEGHLSFGRVRFDAGSVIEHFTEMES
jgi:hypothetical protein